MDQAESLRRMVMRAGFPDRQSDLVGGIRSRYEPHLARAQGNIVLVAGASPSLGTTTVALHVALHWKRRGIATCLVDAHATRPALARLCGVKPRFAWEDILASRRTVRETAVIGPCGLSVVACQHTEDAQATPVAVHDPVVLWQLEQMASSQRLVIDVGDIAALGHYLPMADQCLLVSGPNAEDIKQCYAGAKSIAKDCHRAGLWVACNQVVDEESTLQRAARLQLTCDRCLNLELGLAGLIPLDSRAGQPGISQPVRHRRRIPLVEAVGRVADRLTTRIAAQQAVALVEFSN